MIELSNVSVVLNKKLILENINLKISKGEVISIIGPSGSGKSTLIRTINQLAKTTSGTVKFKGEEINDNNIDRMRQSIGMVFQQFELFPHLTVLENIILAPVTLKKMTREEAVNDAKSLLERVGLLDKIDSLRSTSVTNAANIVEITCAIEDLKNNVAKIDMEIRECNNLIEQFQNKTNRIAALKLALTQIPNKPNTDKDIITLNRDIEVLTENKGKLQANIQYNETIEKITKLKYEAELRGQALTKWVKATDTNGLQTTLMHKPFEELAAKMTGYIQKMYGVTDLKAHFNVTSKANSFSFGLIRDGVYIAYDMLSSGEKCLYTLALMICIIDNNESPLKLLLCDDMFDHLDDKAIENTFIALKQIEDTQFIFAGVQNCENAKDVLVRI
jgi:ABC-type hemin transport system ATPase subunit